MTNESLGSGTSVAIDLLRRVAVEEKGDMKRIATRLERIVSEVKAGLAADAGLTRSTLAPGSVADEIRKAMRTPAIDPRQPK